MHILSSRLPKKSGFKLGVVQYGAQVPFELMSVSTEYFSFFSIFLGVLFKVKGIILLMRCSVLALVIAKPIFSPLFFCRKVIVMFVNIYGVFMRLRLPSPSFFISDVSIAAGGAQSKVFLFL